MKKRLVFLLVLLGCATAEAYVECQPPIICTESWGDKEFHTEVVETRPTRNYVPLEPVKPTPSVMVRGNQQVTLETMSLVPIVDYAPAIQAPEKTEPVGPSMGFQGGRKLRTYYAGSHGSSWTWAQNQRRLE